MTKSELKALVWIAIYEYKNVINSGNAFGLFPRITSRPINQK